MYQDHFAFQSPEDRNQHIWRYLDLAKFLHLIQTSNLYFARADQLGDAFEGSVSKLTKEFRSTFASSLGIVNPSEMQKNLSAGNIAARKQTYINCWHMNSVESAAMWALYGKDTSAIALQSTFQGLIDSFKADPIDVYAGIVSYVDYDSTAIREDNIFYPFLHKRRSFSHEKELRAIVWFTDEQSRKVTLPTTDNPEALNIKVDLDSLIEKIYVSPLAPDWFVQIVKKLIENSKINKPVVHSRLNEEPIF